MHSIRATARHGRALLATAELLAKLRLGYAFVGSVARAAWLGGEVAGGAIDVLALMAPQQKNQVAMMASHRGFRVEREEVEATEELDLVPLNFIDEEGEVRVHVLVASNALYAHMVNAAQEVESPAGVLKVAAVEDTALMAMLSDDEVSVRRLASVAGFDREAFNRRLASIGLAERVLAE